MTYDEDLAVRIRGLLGNESKVREQRMFGGLAFLIGGNMAVAAGQGGMLVRVNPEEADDLVAATGAEVAVMGRRQMPGWLEVSVEDLSDEAELAIWVRRGVDYARSLPEKPGR